MTQPLDPRNRPLADLVVETVPRQGSAWEAPSINWCDKTTWYPTAGTVLDEALVDTGTGLEFSSVEAFWIDVTHGKIMGEYKLNKEPVSAGGYGLEIKVDGVLQTESPPGTTTGDFQVDYDTGLVIFNQNQSGKTVTGSYRYMTSSLWTIKPLAGKLLRLTAVEVQFSEDIVLTDTAMFQPFGLVEVFAPALVDAPYPAGTLIPIADPREYKTMYDYIVEGQRSYPQIPAMGGTSWRGMSTPAQIFRWPYQEDATRDLYSAFGMEYRIWLENDVNFTGEHASATVYGVSVDEQGK